MRTPLRRLLRWGAVAAGVGVLLLSVLVPPESHAQSDATAERVPVFRNVALKKALNYIITSQSANLVYTSRLIRGHRVTCTEPTPGTDALLDCLLSDVPITYTRTDAGTYVLTKGAAPTPTGTVTGVVLDADTKGTLNNANVVIGDGGRGAATSGTGTFAFDAVAPGRHRLVVSYVGYETVVDTVAVTAGHDTHRRIALQPTPVRSGSVVVNDRRVRSSDAEPSRIRAQNLEGTDVGAIGTPDMLRQASALLGVSRQRPLADLHVQGGAAGEHQVRLDGMPVRNPVTLRRLIGAFSPLALGDLTVHKAGFGVKHGSALSGILSATHSLGRASDRHVTARVDPFSANGRAHVDLPMPGARPATVGAAARTSLWSLYPNPTLNQLLLDWNAVDPLLVARQLDVDALTSFVPQAQNSDVQFSDVHAATRVPLGAAHTVSASAYRGDNTIETKFFATEGPQETADSSGAMFAQDRYRWTNGAANVRYEGVLGTRTYTTVQLRASRHTLQRGYHMSYVDLSESTASFSEATTAFRERAASARPTDRNKVAEVTLDAELDHRPSPHHHLSGAVEVKRLSSTFYLDENLSRPLSYDGVDWQISGYLADEMSLGPNTTLDAGLRWTVLPARDAVYAEPRLQVRHQGTLRGLGDVAAQVGVGLYRQFVNRFDLSSASPTSVVPSVRFWLPVGASHAPPKAYHATAGLTAHPASGWTVELEGYYKHQPHLLALDYGAVQPAAGVYRTESALSRPGAVASARGVAMGGGVAVQREGDRVDGTLRYEFSRAQRTFPSRFDGRMEPTPWNQPHRLTATADVSIVAALDAHLSWQGVWGRTWAFRNVYYDRLRGDDPALDPYPLDDPSDHTLPAHTQLGVGLSYRYTWQGVTLHTRADVSNVLDRHNVFDWGLQPTDDGYEKTTRTLPGRRPTLSITVQY